ncbi:hypothetical protein BVG19_g4734 [[Candida] boidinii]|nr:hypothetical protein BVG19_g4734 [[Candida] boidinii]OWB53105.1 hypothetical protein B5S27_g4693 [[Candida] boidinii]
MTTKKVTINDNFNNNNNNFNNLNSSIPSISETSSNISENYKYDNISFSNKNGNTDLVDTSGDYFSDNNTNYLNDQGNDDPDNDSTSSLTFSSIPIDESYIESNEIMNNYKIDLNNSDNLKKINDKLSFKSLNQFAKTPINNSNNNVSSNNNNNLRFNTSSTATGSNNLKLSNIQEKINKINLNTGGNKDSGKGYTPLSHSTPFISGKVQPQPVSHPQPTNLSTIASQQPTNSSTISSHPQPSISTISPIEDERDKLIKNLQEKVSILEIKNSALQLEINKLKENLNSEKGDTTIKDDEVLNYKSFKFSNVSKYNELQLNKIDELSNTDLKNYLKLLIFKFNVPLNKFFKFIYYNFKNLIEYESFFNNIHKSIYNNPINSSFKISQQLQNDDHDEDDGEWILYKDSKCEENFKNLQKCLYKTNEILNSKNI